VTILFSIAGSLVFALLAIVVALGAWQRTRRVPCVGCGLSIAPSAQSCPFCHVTQR
jgi:cytochrome oxidase assembly protein ShyY1